MDTEQTLEEFLKHHALPVRVKVTEGLYCPEQLEWEFSTGDTLDLHQITCPTARLSFVDPDSGDERTLTASTWSPCLFKIMSYIPGLALEPNKPMIIQGVLKLIRYWPSVVCVRDNYQDNCITLNKGDKLRLKRVINNAGLYLECSMYHSKLVLLPMSCDCEFLVVDDTVPYTLSEITGMPGKVERRLRLSDDIINRSNPLPGIPTDFIGDLIMSVPQRYVEIHPAESPGEKIIVPITLDLTVSLREQNYTSASIIWYPLRHFIEVNKDKLPMRVVITDWEEEPITVQAIRASVHDRIILHHTDQVMKIICHFNQRHFLIPMTYDAPFEVVLRTFDNLQSVCSAKVKYVKIMKTVASLNPFISGVNNGDVVEILHDQVESGVVVVLKQDQTEHRLAIGVQGEYEEVIPFLSGTRIYLNEIEPTMLPLTVVLHEPSVSIPPRRDILPRGQLVQLLSMVSESCVVTSKDTDRGYSSPIPLRSGINIRFISDFISRVAPPDISLLASCPEEISDRDVLELQAVTLPSDYEDVRTTSQPTLHPRLHSTRTNQTLDFKRKIHGLRSSRIGCPLPPVPEGSSTLPSRHLDGSSTLPNRGTSGYHHPLLTSAAVSANDRLGGITRHQSYR